MTKPAVLHMLPHQVTVDSSTPLARDSQRGQTPVIYLTNVPITGVPEARDVLSNRLGSVAGLR